MKKKYNRINGFMIIIAIIFVVLIAKLIFLQIFQGDDYRNIADNLAERPVMEIAPRGEILDRNSQKLATNVLSYNVTYSVQIKQNDDERNNVLSQIIKILNKDGSIDKLNMQNIPIIYNATSDSYSFIYKGSDESIAKAIRNFETQNKIIKNDDKVATVDAKSAFFMLAEKYKLVDKNNAGKYILKYDLNNELLYRAVGLRLTLDSVSYSQYKDVYLATNIKKETFYDIKFKIDNYIGVSCEIAPLRYYPNGDIGSCVLGYLGKISDSDKYKNLGYDISRELIGISGLEGSLENNSDLNIKLRGEPGTKWYKVDNVGKVIKETATLDPVPGDTVVTTIDLNVQKVAEKAFDDLMEQIRNGKIGNGTKYPNANRGGLVALDVNTGEIIAMVSKPGFDPNQFAENGSIKDPDLLNKLFYPDIEYQDKLKTIPQLQKEQKSPYTDKYDVLPKPLFNYATCGQAPPGSTFKPLTAIAALEEGKITKDTIVVDLGLYTVVDGFKGKCWLFDDYGATHGAVNVVKALEVSCNYFFFEVGRRLGYDKIGEWAWKFGIGNNPQNNDTPSSGIEILEQPGSVGSPIAYKNKNINFVMNQVVDDLKKKYGGYDIIKGREEYAVIKAMLMDGSSKYDESKLTKIGINNSKAISYIKGTIKSFDANASRPGDPLNVAIGQGDTALTPLQMAQYLATIINGGTRYKAHLVKEVLNPDGTVKKEIQPEVINKIDLKKENVDTVKEGMQKVNEEGGTASNIFGGYPITTGGKTGTAQWGTSTAAQAEYGRDAYGWFLSFAPYDNPKIVVAAVVYDGGHGNFVGNIVKAVYDEYFGLNKTVQVTTP